MLIDKVYQFLRNVICELIRKVSQFLRNVICELIRSYQLSPFRSLEVK
jgi:hypothetical protein